MRSVLACTGASCYHWCRTSWTRCCTEAVETGYRGEWRSRHFIICHSAYVLHKEKLTSSEVLVRFSIGPDGSEVWVSNLNGLDSGSNDGFFANIEFLVWCKRVTWGVRLWLTMCSIHWSWLLIQNSSSYSFVFMAKYEIWCDFWIANVQLIAQDYHRGKSWWISLTSWMTTAVAKAASSFVFRLLPAQLNRCASQKRQNGSVDSTEWCIIVGQYLIGVFFQAVQR